MYFHFTTCVLMYTKVATNKKTKTHAYTTASVTKNTHFYYSLELPEVLYFTLKRHVY